MKKILLSALLLSSVSLATFAQETGINSPFTRYGVGRITDGSLGFNKAMAGTGYDGTMASNSTLQTLHLMHISTPSPSF